MKFSTSCLLAVAILGTASAQTYSMGNCNPNLETVNNFNKTKFAGKWYEIKRSFNVPELDTKCFKGHFNLAEEGVYHVELSSESKNQGNKPQLAAFKHKADDLKKGKLKFVPGFIKDEQPFWILDTDYENYGIAYSCVDYHQGKLEYVWTMSRKPTINNELSRYMDKSLMDSNIILELITEVQDCE